MNSPYFSVIIPTYNRTSSLKRAIDSALLQSFTDYELIVVDDGSTDDTQVLLSNYKGIISLKQENSGVSSARNLGATYARGKWLCFLDSDDEWRLDKLKQTYNYIVSNPEFKLIHSNEIWIRNGVRVNLMNKHLKGGGDQYLRSIDFCRISPSASCILKETFDFLGGFREDFEVCEDYDLWLKFTSLYSVGFIEDTLVTKYGGANDQLSTKFFAMDAWRIQSLVWVLENRDLDTERAAKTKQVLLKKAKVLLKGYVKYGHVDKAHDLSLIINKYS